MISNTLKLVMLLGHLVNATPSGPFVPDQMAKAFPWCNESAETYEYCAQAYEDNGEDVFVIPSDSWNG